MIKKEGKNVKTITHLRFFFFELRSFRNAKVRRDSGEFAFIRAVFGNKKSKIIVAMTETHELDAAIDNAIDNARCYENVASCEFDRDLPAAVMRTEQNRDGASRDGASRSDTRDASEERGGSDGGDDGVAIMSAKKWRPWLFDRFLWLQSNWIAKCERHNDVHRATAEMYVGISIKNDTYMEAKGRHFFLNGVKFSLKMRN